MANLMVETETHSQSSVYMPRASGIRVIEMKASSHEAWKHYREHNVDIFYDSDENCRKNTEEQEIHAEARRVPSKLVPLKSKMP